jgi:ADP-ribose pyrophosphatase YjhB (NUDIX family)
MAYFPTFRNPIPRIRGGLTLGAQGALIDSSERVLLVRHGYRPGWFFPGGGVELGEHIEHALARELREEVGATLIGPPLLHGVFANFASFPGDHIALFVARVWEQSEPELNNGEIAEVGLFARAALPADTDPGTRLRIEEILDGRVPAAMWSPTAQVRGRA